MPGKNDPGPSVKDNDTYEALRDKGYSKEKSARIANAKADPEPQPLEEGWARPAVRGLDQGRPDGPRQGDRDRGAERYVEGPVDRGAAEPLTSSDR